MELTTTATLSSVYCRDEADGIGNAEPYLWSIFFKIDGETIRQSGVSLTGDAVFHFSPGSHEDLNTHDVEDNDSVAIPSAIGLWTTRLQPIIIKDLSNKIHPIPGIIGIAAVLMEEDNVSDAGAEAGHQALNNFIRKSINDFIHGISLLEFVNESHPEEKLKEMTDGLIAKIKDESEGIVRNAITNKQSWYNNLWSGLNPDDNIGSEVWVYNQDEIVNHQYSISLRQRWQNEGDWEIFGSLSAPDPCRNFVVAVNQQNMQINEMRHEISSIRGRMRNASPAMRVALQREINEREASLQNLETELHRLESLVQRCRIRQRMIMSPFAESALSGHNISTN